MTAGKATAWTVDRAEHEVVGWSLQRLPFDPGGEMREYRDTLREALRALKPREGCGLVVEYSSVDPTKADLENVTLYNLGGWSHLAQRGLMCRRLATDSPTSCSIASHHCRPSVVARISPGSWLICLSDPRFVRRTGGPHAGQECGC